MASAKDLTGKTFDRLTVLFRGANGKDGHASWFCFCDCGKTVNVLSNNLQSKGFKSCGCYTAQRASLLNLQHGLTKTKEFKAWGAMLQRCYNPNNPSYHRYGGRGIAVCVQWRKSFIAFFNDVGPAPSKKLSVDRIDNDGNYEPSNCRWATAKQQRNNQSKKNNL